MSTSVKADGSYTVRGLNPGTIDDIRILAATHRVTHAQVIEEALWNFQTELGKHIPVPDNWRVPSGWRSAERLG